jgi:protein gp37
MRGAAMSSKYWDKPWSLIDGCTPCSPGCDHCWSARMAHRSYREHLTTTEGKLNGHVRVRPDRLDIPLRTRKPTVFAVWNDLFHEDVPDDFRDQAFGMMANCERHTFLVLTKRHAQMAEYFANEWRWALIEGNAQKIYANKHHKDPSMWFAVHDLPHVYFGLTVCNQPEADEKIPELLKVPGKHFLSIEPMLGPIDLKPLLGFWQWSRSENFQTWVSHKPSPIDLVILGGGTGQGARPMPPDWPRSVRDQCDAANVLFYFKQWGEWAEIDWDNWPSRTARYVYVYPTGMVRIGRKHTGRILDGKEHNDLPWRKAQ